MTNTTQYLQLNSLSATLFECAKQGVFIDAPVILKFTGNLPLAGYFIAGHTVSCSIRNMGGSFIDTNYIPNEDDGARSIANLALQFVVGGIGGLFKYSITGGAPLIGLVNNGLYQLTGKALSLSGALASTILIEVTDEVLKATAGKPYNIELGIKIGAAITVASAIYVSGIPDKIFDIAVEALPEFIVGKTYVDEGNVEL